MTTTVESVLNAVADQFGIRFSETGTGGGCMALQARLESGHWIVATDEGLCALAERIVFESHGDNYNGHAGDDHTACGWSVGIYPNGTEHGEDWWGGTDSIVDVVDWDAYARDLPTVVGRALAALADSVRR